MSKNKKDDNDWCAYPRCKGLSDVIWLGVGICGTHFKKVCDMPIEKAYKVMQVSKTEIKKNSTPCVD